MEDETFGKGSTLILGRPFLMTPRTKIDVHVGTLSMEFGDTLVQFNIFEVMKHPTEDHSLFGIDLIDELVEEYLQLDNSSEDSENFAGSTNLISCLGSITEEADYAEVHNFPNSEDNNNDIADLDFETELFKLLDQACNLENPECVNRVKAKDAETKIPFFAQLATIFMTETESAKRGQDEEKIGVNLAQQLRDKADMLVETISANEDQKQASAKLIVPSRSDPKAAQRPKANSNLTRIEDTKRIIIANNLHQEQEDKLLNILRQHKKAIGWKLSDLPSINPSICMHRILMEEEFKPIRQQQRRLNLTILDVVKKEVTRLLAVGIIYPILDSQWATRKDHFPLPVIDQVLEKLARKSHYCFLDGFSRYMQIHIVPEDQHKTTFTCPFGTFAYSRMPFGLCNAPSTFQRCMTSIFSDLLQDCMEVFMDDFVVYADSFDACLENLSKVLRRCIDINLVLNFEKCHFMVTEGIVLGHLVSNRGIEVDKSKIDIISSLPNPASMPEVRSFLGHAGFYRRFIKNFSKLALPLSRLLQKDVDFTFDQPCIESFQELKNRLTSAPILQAPN
ncbi:Retrovirus-related Pol polyprotein from transposon 17.6, partial [Mucuna pruriens]